MSHINDKNSKKRKKIFLLASVHKYLIWKGTGRKMFIEIPVRWIKIV